MKRSVKEWGLRILILLAGLTVAHLGVTLFLLSDLGSDPFNVLVQGAFRTLSRILSGTWLTHGRVHMGVNLLIILVLLFIDRSYIKIGTALCMLFGGPIIDLFTALLSPLTSGASLALRFCVIVDVTFALLGFLLGGTVGAGTLVCMFLVGPVAGFFMPVNGKWIEAAVKRFCG